VSDQWNTVSDDFEGVVRNAPLRARPAVEMLPTEPPAEVIPDYQAANRVVDQLAERGVHLHFATHSDSDRLYIQMLNKDGRVIADVSPLRLLEALADGCNLRDAGIRGQR
jgi:hypothetical protein